MTARTPTIGIFAKILSETPAQKRERLLGIYRECGGKALHPVVECNPDPQTHQVYYRPKVGTEMR